MASSADYPASSADYPVSSADYPVLFTDYPVLSTDYPVLSADYPVLSADYPVLSADYPVLSADYPVLSTDYPGLSADYPAFIGQETPDLDIVQEIDKFLEEYNSDADEQAENSNFPDKLVDDLLKNVDMVDLENTFLDEISQETYSIDEIKEIDNFSFYRYNQRGFSITENSLERYSNNSTALYEINTKNDTDNDLAFFSKKIDNIQDFINAPQNNDDQNVENQDSINASRNNDDQTIENQNNTSNSRKPRKKKRKNNNPTNFKSKLLNNNSNNKKKESLNMKKNKKRNNDEPLVHETKKKCSSIIDDELPKTAFFQQKNTELQSSKPKPRQPKKKKHGINQSDNNKPFVKNNNEFQKSNIRNHGPAFSDFHQNPCQASTSTIQSSDEYNNRLFNNNAPLNPYDFKRQNQNNLPLDLPKFNGKEPFDLPHHENQQRFEHKVQKPSISPILPVKQNLCHVQSQCPQNCVQNQAISKQTNYKNIDKSNILLYYIIKDHLRPVSLDETTVQFSSKKLINTKTRSDIVIALENHGILEHSWWTPDDMFFARFTLREMAEFVYEMYLKY